MYATIQARQNVADEVRDYLLYQCHQALSIDHGINNWLTCVSSLGKSFNWAQSSLAGMKDKKMELM